MPVFFIPVVAGALGFGGGLIASDAITKLTKLALVVGAGYLVYAKVAK